MKNKLKLVITIAFLLGACQHTSMDKPKDPNLWLEKIEGKKALDWVKKQNERSESSLTNDKDFSSLYKKNLKILKAKDRVPEIKVVGNYIYTLWQGDSQSRGSWKRTKIGSSYKPVPSWETVLDIDKLSRKEKKKLVLKDYKCLQPKGELCLLMLSEGGTDAVSIREFNTKKKSFVKNGFKFKKGNYWAAWVNKDSISLSADFGPNTLTKAGYGRELRLASRKTKSEKWPKLLQVPEDYLTIVTENVDGPDGTINVAYRYHSQLNNAANIITGDKAEKLPTPLASMVHGKIEGDIVISLKKEWQHQSKKYPKNSVVTFNPETNKVKLIYKAPKGAAVQNAGVVKNFIVVEVLENVRRKLKVFQGSNGKFTAKAVPQKLDKTQTGIVASHFNKNILFVKTEDYLSPTTLYAFNLSKNSLKKVSGQSKKFKSNGLTYIQKWTKSKDGTKIPYYLVGDSRVKKKGPAPVILTAYGGFGIPFLPKYDPVLGKSWLEQGGLYAVANIRGGGEFGPEWHKAAMKEKRQNAYDDFIAVAEDLIKSNVTTSQQLGIYGGSNGGLLVGAVMTQRPELFGGVVCVVPLLDMVRFSKLLVGSAWVGEYGDPDKPNELKHLLKISPYHNLKKDKKYPPVFFYTSTKDDRVHPGHARKMVYKMQSIGADNVLYYENMEGGHAGSSTLAQQAKWKTMTYQFFKKNLATK